MVTFDIQVISDTVCPWCYIGKRRLEAGIAAYKAAHPNTQDTFKVTWFPFYLRPDAPTTGVDKAERYRQLLGSQTQARWDMLSAAGREVGINFKWGGLTGHTRDSHRLIRYAGIHGGVSVQNVLVEELFSLFFENEADNTSHAVLRGAAVKAGLDGDQVQKYLESKEDRAAVDREVLNAQLKGVHGVPNITINEMVRMPGAVEADVYVQVFDKVKAALEDDDE